MAGFKFNTPPGWPPAPRGWVPPTGWQPDPTWPKAPVGWQFWMPDDAEEQTTTTQPDAPSSTPTGGPTDPERRRDDGTDPPDQTEAQVAPAEHRTDGDAAVEEAASPIEPAAHGVTEFDPLMSAKRVEVERLEAQVSTLAGEVRRMNAILQSSEANDLRSQLVELNDAVLLQQVGIYEYHHPLENAEAYRERLKQLQEHIRELVRSRHAIEASERFAYNNSVAQGRKMTRDFSKLMLRAYNAEADNCVRTVKAGNVKSAVTRLGKSKEAIAKLGQMMEMRVTEEYHALRVTEIELTGDYQMRLQEEREAAREERERLREQRRAEQELQAERDRLDKERSHYLNALNALVAQGKQDEAVQLQRRVDSIDEAIKLNDYRIANIRAGYVYVISNVGSFGQRVVKIGLTRRLDPLDRVRELGDASVPFPFDVHAIYFSDDAVSLESELHAAFGEQRLNRVNLRREFFFATPAQVREVLTEKVGNLLEFTEVPEAIQYHQSLQLWPQGKEAARIAEHEA
ncbi:DUF4041 domain-containing protein [Segeticoccus rhizosphaerae]|uniref:DUF4041 domain-containing protein n=1 Tax=Segeticoccus rhizosphaerae TaxID=1104777 RepID=UPI00126546CD|nr:DUF4041 domain-containing protein [Segeticoccus rhizosphaerae]